MALSCRGGAVHSITTGLMHRSKHEVGPSPRSVSLDLSVECPFNKFYGINCRPKLGAKLFDRFFHRRRQVSPPASNATHRFFDGSQHFLYCNFTVGSRHGAVASFFQQISYSKTDLRSRMGSKRQGNQTSPELAH